MNIILKLRSESMRNLFLLLVFCSVTLGSCQCSNKPEVGPVEGESAASVIPADAVGLVATLPRA